MKYAQSSDFSVGCHQWMSAGSVSAFLKYILSSTVGNWLVHHHAPVSESWNWVLSAIQMRILVAVVLNWPKIQVMHVLKQNQPNKKGKKKRQEQTNKKVTKNPSDTVSRLKDNVDQWIHFFWNCKTVCVHLAPALLAGAPCVMVVKAFKRLLWTGLGKLSCFKSLFGRRLI